MCLTVLYIWTFLGCGGQALRDAAGEVDSGQSSDTAASIPVAWEEELSGVGFETVDIDEHDEPVDIDEDGWSEDLDCNDLDARIHPGAPEFCDGIDTDCDGVIDPNNAVDAEIWFRDLDGDGYGNPEDTVNACLHPGVPFVAEGGDCDDTMETIHPGAPEIWDGIDNDCDGRIDPGPLVGKWAGL